MAKVDLSKYGITGTTEVVYNPSYEQLFEEETKPSLEGYEVGKVSELGAVDVTILTHQSHDRSGLHIQVDMLQHLISTEGFAHAIDR